VLLLGVLGLGFLEVPPEQAQVDEWPAWRGLSRRALGGHARVVSQLDDGGAVLAAHAVGLHVDQRLRQLRLLRLARGAGKLPVASLDDPADRAGLVTLWPMALLLALIAGCRPAWECVAAARTRLGGLDERAGLYDGANRGLERDSHQLTQGGVDGVPDVEGGRRAGVRRDGGLNRAQRYHCEEQSQHAAHLKPALAGAEAIKTAAPAERLRWTAAATGWPVIRSVTD
jgi:hypothetical protein